MQRREASRWETSELAAPRPQEGQGFGSSFALSADGTRLVVGALFDEPTESDPGRIHAEAAEGEQRVLYTFRAEGGAWQPDGEPWRAERGETFERVQMSDDGELLVVSKSGVIELLTRTGVAGGGRTSSIRLCAALTPLSTRPGSASRWSAR